MIFFLINEKEIKNEFKKEYRLDQITRMIILSLIYQKNMKYKKD